MRNKNPNRCIESPKRIVTNCEIITKADIGEDHTLVTMTMRMNTRLAKSENHKKQQHQQQQNSISTHKNSQAINKDLTLILKTDFKKLGGGDSR